MSDRLAVIAENGLQFFGKVSASLSHEFRNVLATLYENAGLLEDLVLMAEKGMPLDAKRVKDLATRLKGQVRRGTEIADNMNRFAHSVDEPLASVNLYEMLDLVTSLAQRTASVHGVALQTRNAGPPLVIRIAPFGLENLIWLCLDLGMRAKLTEKTLTVAADPGETGACIRFRGFQGLREFREDDVSVQRLDGLARAVGAVVTLDEENKEIVLSIHQDTGGR
jgi:C4-dicarboxylate-specific signal transduction histidine kinase